MALGVPLITVDHLEGHLYACQLAHPDREVYPCVGLVVSGGHTSLYACRGPIESELLGGTIDDAAGEAFDKVSSLLGLGYPGGPGIERAARDGDPKAFAFPRTFLKDDRLAFSFSGLKTAVLYALKGQDAAVDRPLAAEGARGRPRGELPGGGGRRPGRQGGQALDRTGYPRLGIGGGVAVNGRFREAVEAMASGRGVELFLPPVSLCTDNAAMAGIALAKLAAGQVAEPRRGGHAGPGPAGSVRSGQVRWLDQARTYPAVRGPGTTGVAGAAATAGRGLGLATRARPGSGREPSMGWGSGGYSTSLGLTSARFAGNMTVGDLPYPQSTSTMAGVIENSKDGG